jgi:hypothetical protein
MLHFLLPLEFSALPLILFLANIAKPLPATQREENTKRKGDWQILLCKGVRGRSPFRNRELYF